VENFFVYRLFKISKRATTDERTKFHLGCGEQPKMPQTPRKKGDTFMKIILNAKINETRPLSGNYAGGEAVKSAVDGIKLLRTRR
jgi:hypothetical protein